MINNFICFCYGLLIGYEICLVIEIINDIRNEGKDE